MGLIGKFFKGGEVKEAASSQFPESRAPTALEQTKSLNGPRRDLVRVVLRETMRKHGIPSDWLECRSLSVLTRHHKQGMHVQFLVRQGDQQLLQWLHAFQESFWEQILRTDPHARQWLFSVGWEFYGKSVQGFNVLPGPGAWAPAQQAVEAQQAHVDTQPGEPDVDEASVEDDLQALQAALSMPAALVDLPDGPAPAAKKPR